LNGEWRISIRRYGEIETSNLKGDINRASASEQIQGQLESLMETIALSAEASSPPPNLWHGSNGQSIPLNVLHQPSLLGEPIASGAYGSVFLYKDPKDATKKMAIKKIGYMRSKITEPVDKVLQEVKMHATLKHPNIIQYYGSHIADRHICILMEYADGGSLKNHLAVNGRLKIHLLIHFTKGILKGLHYLHTLPQPIIHRDLRSPNVLISGNNIVKLGDFGLSKQLDDLYLSSGFTTAGVGNLLWRAPEMIDDEADDNMGRKVDLWSTGVTVLEMLWVKPPLFEVDVAKYIRMWVKEQHDAIRELLRAPEWLTNKNTMDVLKYCLEFNANDRKTAAEILKIVWNIDV